LDARIQQDGAGEVEFVARYRIGGASATKLHERSRFVREDERWFYLNGDIT
jgi:SEC-C motif-containing protein